MSDLTHGIVPAGNGSASAVPWLTLARWVRCFRIGALSNHAADPSETGNVRTRLGVCLCLEPLQTVLDGDALLFCLNRSPFPHGALPGFPVCAFFGGFPLAAFVENMLSGSFHFIVEHRGVLVRRERQCEALRLEPGILSERTMEPDAKPPCLFERRETLL